MAASSSSETGRVWGQTPDIDVHSPELCDDLAFLDAWGQFCRDAFGTEAALMRAFPGICERTARRWLDGKTAPRGRHVARAGVIFNFMGDRQ